jgi:hypothetical protein
MAIRSARNAYNGVNAHLHSLLQSPPSDWESFHTSHIVDLVRAIKPTLPPRYSATLEKSLQIREYHTDTGLRIVRRPKPDVIIFDYETPRTPSGGTAAAATATWTQAITDTFDTELTQRLTAIVIYERVDDQRRGRPITQIELLSPTNKTDGLIPYVEKRMGALKSGLALVEIDYLHESESPIFGVPSYPHHEAGATAYNITISTPQPSFEEGTSTTHGFGVDIAIPRLDIPLADDDVVVVDFGSVYDITYAAMTEFGEDVDYAAPPLHMERYSAADQARIRARMQAVAEGMEGA